MLCGGYGKDQDMNEEVELMLQSLKPEVEAQLGVTFEFFAGVSFKSQLVSGMNYLVLIDVGNNQTITVKFFKPLPHTQQPHELKQASFN